MEKEAFLQKRTPYDFICYKILFQVILFTFLKDENWLNMNLSKVEITYDFEKKTYGPVWNVFKPTKICPTIF